MVEHGLLYDLIRAPQYGRRNRQPEGLGGLEIYDQLESRWLFDRKISGLRAFQNLVDIARGAPVQVKTSTA